MGGKETENERETERRERDVPKGRLGRPEIACAAGTVREGGRGGRDDFVDVLYRARSSTTRLRGYLDTRVESAYKRV